MKFNGTESMTVSISARGLMELLAGVVSHADFIKAHPWEEGRNYFADALSAGRPIVSMIVEENPGADDDFVTIEFGEIDAAIAPFFLRPEM